MKIAWLSNPPFTYSGYAIQSKLFIKRLQQSGHQVVAVVNRLLDEGPAMTMDGIYCFPGGRGRWIGDNFHWGWRGLMEVVRRWQPDIAISLFDIWTFPHNLGNMIEEAGSVWLPITPIDHDPVSPEVLARLQGLKFPIAMSRFGQKKMIEAGIVNPLYIPHAVDTSLFRPYPPNPIVRNSMGGKDKFIIGIVAANRSYYDRKAWSENLKAVGILQKKHDDVCLYIHTIDSQLEDGLNLNLMATQFGVKYSVPDVWQMIEGFPEHKMVDIINAFDVLLLASRGEGFGVPLIEAQACGVPVITTNFTTGPELCGSGWLVEPKSLYYDEQYSYQAIPDVDKIVEKLEYAYNLWKRNNMAEKKMEARKFAMNYDIDLVYAGYMLPVLMKAVNYQLAKKEKANEKDGQIRSNKSHKTTNTRRKSRK